MKKFIGILLAVVSIFTLAACKDQEVINDTAVTAAFDNASINQNSITIELTVDDPDDEITGTIYARLYDVDDHAISSRSFSKSTVSDHALDAVTITFAGLGLEQAYYISVVVTVERDTITVETYEFQTIGTIHITTVEEFMNMDDYRGADYILDNDLDFSDVDFATPFSNVYFSGTFDGQGYALSNIHIKTSKSTTDPNSNYYYIGVFGYLSSSAEISNVVLDYVTIGSEAEPQQLNNSARVGFFAGYIASSSVIVENVTVQNSHMYIQSSSDNYVIIGGLVGESKGEFTGGTITDSSINLTTTEVQTNGRFLVRMGGAVGYLQPDGELHEVNVDVDLTYETLITEFVEDDGMKVAIGGAIGDNNAINSADSVTDVIATGDLDVTININPVEEVYGNYALYLGGLIGYSSTEITNGFFGGSLTVDHVSQANDASINKKVYVGGLYGYYGIQKVNEQLVWVADGNAITVSVGADVDVHADSLIGFEPKSPAHIYGVVGTESVVVNTITKEPTAPVIADMTDYFTSDFANDAYEALILG